MSSKRDSVSEGEMLGLLRTRHLEKGGNGEAWAFVTHVRSAAGFDAKRTIDALAMSLWPSRGLLLHGYEVKCSRSDWLREMRNPAKAEEFCTKLDFFSLVVADEKIVQEGELPPTWGLIVKRGSKLVTKVQAPALRDLSDNNLPPAFGRSFLAAMLREACRVGGATPAEIKEAVDEASALAERSWAGNLKWAEERAAAAEKTIQDFERESGLSMRFTRGAKDAADLGRAVKTVLDGEFQVENVRNQLARVAADARRVAEFAERMQTEFGGDSQQSLGVAA